MIVKADHIYLFTVKTYTTCLVAIAVVAQQGA